jgi:tetratricopeptide (TPR) repeat protein
MSYPTLDGADAALVSNLPPQDLDFTGRDPLLTDTAEAFARAENRLAVQGFFGPEGVGKSAAAIELAHRCRDRYQLVWFIRAGFPETLDADLEALARRLGLEVNDQSLEPPVQAVLDALSRRDRWLLIFDDAPTVKSIARLLPRGIHQAGSTGDVLITSRNPKGYGVAIMRRLGPMERAESITFLRRRTGKQYSQFAAARIAAALRDTPAAMELACTLIRRGAITFDEYLKRFEQLWAELLARKEHETDAPIPLQMGYELCYRELEVQDPTAADLLRLCCFFGAGDIRLEFLRRGAPYVLEPLRSTLKDLQAMQRALEMAQSFGLARLDEDSVTIDPLLARLRRRRMVPEERRECVKIALSLTHDLFHFDNYDTKTYRDCAALVYHAISVAEEALAERVNQKESAELLNELGEFLLRQGRFGEAKEALDRALSVWEEVNGGDHPAIASIACNLGRAMIKLGETEDAKRLLDRALELDEQHYGLTHPHVAEVLNNLGLCLHQAGDLQGARGLFERSMAICRENQSIDRGKSAVILNNLGYLYLERRELTEAEMHLQVALDMVRQRHGEQHPDVATILTNLGAALRLRGNLVEARKHCERAARIDQVLLGRKHPDLARDLFHLAQVHLAMKDVGAARVLFERALTIDEAAFGPDHPGLARRLEGLGQALKAQGEIDQATNHFTRAKLLKRRDPAAT